MRHDLGSAFSSFAARKAIFLLAAICTAAPARSAEGCAGLSPTGVLQAKTGVVVPRLLASCVDLPAGGIAAGREASPRP